MRFLTWLLRALTTNLQVSERPKKLQRSRLRVEPLEDRMLLAADLSNLVLDNDTGASSTDKITSDATISADVSWTSPNTAKVTVEFDHDGDGMYEGSVEEITTSGYSFTYNPLSTDSSLDLYEGSLPFRYRTIEYTANGDPTTNSWIDFNFTLDRVAPDIVSTTPSDTDLLSTTPSTADVVFDEEISAASITALTVSVDGVGTTISPNQTVATSASDTATVTFVGPGIPGGVYKMTVSSVTDLAGNVLGSTHTSQWRLTAAPTTSGITTVNDDEDAANRVVTLSDYFDDEYDDSTTLTYEVVNNTNSTLFASTDITGTQLTLDYAADQFGTADVTIRATDTDGLWIDEVFTVDVASVNDAPSIVDFTVSETLGIYTFEGQVIDEAANGLTVTFAGLLTGHSATTDADGYFWYSLALSQSGTVTAQTTDTGSLTSNAPNVQVV